MHYTFLASEYMSVSPPSDPMTPHQRAVDAVLRADYGLRLSSLMGALTAVGATPQVIAGVVSQLTGQTVSRRTVSRWQERDDAAA